MKSVLRSFLKFLGYELRHIQAPPSLTIRFPDAVPWEMEIMKAISPHTMTPPERQWALIRAVEHVVMHEIPGDIVECGVWKGGNLMLAGLVLNQMQSQRTIFAYDTFAGMSAPTEFDRKTQGGMAVDEKFSALDRGDFNEWCYGPLNTVKNNIQSVGLSLSSFRFIQGKCEDTLALPENLPDKISILRLDTDWYESTKAELEVLYDRLSPGGILILDDYGDWAGAKKAVDEYFGNKMPFLCRIDRSCRIAVRH